MTIDQYCSDIRPLKNVALHTEDSELLSRNAQTRRGLAQLACLHLKESDVVRANLAGHLHAAAAVHLVARDALVLEDLLELRRFTLVVVPLNDVVLRRLRAIVKTVRSGDPFVAASVTPLPRPMMHTRSAMRSRCRGCLGSRCCTAQLA